MARRRNNEEDLNVSVRENPYNDISDDEDDFIDDQADGDFDSGDDAQPSGGRAIRILIAVVVVLVAVLVALLLLRRFMPDQLNNLFNRRVEATAAPAETDTGIVVSQLPGTVEETKAPVDTVTFAPIIFANTTTPVPATYNTSLPSSDSSNDIETGADTEDDMDVSATADSSDMDDTGAVDEDTEDLADDTSDADAVDAPEQTAKPTVSESALPIILTNTPTPTPTATPTPTPEPTPTPTPSPVPEIGKGVTNRDANLRGTAASSGKVLKTIKKGETVTIHETSVDSSRNVWYYLTVDDSGNEGWMRDYVVTLTAPLIASTASDSEESTTQTTAAVSLPEGVIATGKTNHDANMRKIMNGTVITQLRKGKKVEILSARNDKKGQLWFEVRPDGSTKTGYILASLINLDAGFVIDGPTVESTSATTSTTAASTLPEGAIGTGKINHDANFRKVKGGTIITQLRNGRQVTIYSAEYDKNGKLWYLVQPKNSNTQGYVLATLVTLSSGYTEAGLIEASGAAATENETESTSSVSALATQVPLEGTVSQTTSLSTSNSSTTSSGATSTTENIQDREVIGTAVTNREANVRQTPVSNGKLVRQLSKGVNLNILSMFENKSEIWYEVATTSGKTHGFVRDYVLRVINLQEGVTATQWEE